MIKNDYYSIAINDIRYLQAGLGRGYYNNIAVGAQQIAEKMLKSAVELACPSPESMLKNNNLRKMADSLRDNGVTIETDRDKLSTLKDYYFEARYPGDDFVEVTEAECDTCLDTMYRVVEDINRFREERGLPVEQIEELYEKGKQ